MSHKFVHYGDRRYDKEETKLDKSRKFRVELTVKEFLRKGLTEVDIV